MHACMQMHLHQRRQVREQLWAIRRGIARRGRFRLTRALALDSFLSVGDPGLDGGLEREWWCALRTTPRSCRSSIIERRRCTVRRATEHIIIATPCSDCIRSNFRLQDYTCAPNDLYRCGLESSRAGDGGRPHSRQAELCHCLEPRPQVAFTRPVEQPNQPNAACSQCPSLSGSATFKGQRPNACFGAMARFTTFNARGGRSMSVAG